jgi:RNA polymerase sigma factor (sigma-70 family)
MSSDVRRTIETVWRIESARLIAGLARITRDVGLAEELAQDALVTALEQWPTTGVPDNPGAWLMHAGKNRAIDRVRRHKMVDRKHEQIGAELGARPDLTVEQIEAAVDDDVRDDMLKLIFTCCHPVLSREARVALTLRLLGGLSAEEIARAFLVSEATMQQRIVRAKKALAEGKVAYEVPRGEDLAPRLASVLEVVYLVFNEGYSATAGDDWTRPALIEDALRLARVLQGLAPDEPEVHGLAALLELQASRIRARTAANGDPILLNDQNRLHWDPLLIRRGLGALARAEELHRSAQTAMGPYVLQAAIAACHARAKTASETDWHRIAALYGALVERTGSPIVELNRAVAVAMAQGPEHGLEIADELVDEPSLANYHLLPSVRGDLLLRVGRFAEARAELERAAGMTKNARERELLRAKAASCGSIPPLVR